MPPKKDYWDIIKDEDVFLRYFNEENKRLVGITLKISIGYSSRVVWSLRAYVSNI